jgi:hypothetical protein
VIFFKTRSEDAARTPKADTEFAEATNKPTASPTSNKLLATTGGRVVVEPGGRVLVDLGASRDQVEPFFARYETAWLHGPYPFLFLERTETLKIFPEDKFRRVHFVDFPDVVQVAAPTFT